MEQLFYCETAAQGFTLSFDGVLPAAREESFVLPQVDRSFGSCITLQVPEIVSNWQLNADVVCSILITVTNAVYRAVQKVRNAVVACRRFYSVKVEREPDPVVRLLRALRL